MLIAAVGLSSNRNPFCEDCEAYMERRVVQYPLEATPVLLEALQRGDVAALERLTPLTAEGSEQAELEVWLCPSCRVRGYWSLVVRWRTGGKLAKQFTRRIFSGVLPEGGVQHLSSPGLAP